MNVLDAIRTRRSVALLTGEISEEIIDTLLEMARCAPNHHSTAPWTFTLVAGEARKRLGQQWAEVLGEELRLNAEAKVTFIAGEARKLERAPVLLFVSVRTDASPEVATEDFAATAAAVQNILLAAHGLGLGAIWRTGRMAYHPAMRRFLHLADNDRIVAIVYIGQRASAAPDPPSHATLKSGPEASPKVRVFLEGPEFASPQHESEASSQSHHD